VLYERQSVKAWRANVLYIAVPLAVGVVKAIRVRSFPCGGFNRLVGRGLEGYALIWGVCRIRAQATVAELRAVLASVAKL
jgi:hypothetical protein